MPAAASSNIRAFVQWNSPTVYAGEDIECIITFKNIAPAPGQERGRGVPPNVHGNGNHQDRKASNALPVLPSRKSSLPQSKPLSRAPSVTGARVVSSGKGHRPALSLNIVSAPSRAGLQSAPIQQPSVHSAFKPTRTHGRSLSIMSLGSEVGSEDRRPAPIAPTRRPSRAAHSRSASLQHLPRSLPLSTQSAGGQTPRQPSPLYESTVATPASETSVQPIPQRPGRRKPGVVSAGNTPTLGSSSTGQRKVSTDSQSSNINNFRFPAVGRTGSMSPTQPEPPRPPRSPSTMHSAQNRPRSPRAQEWTSTVNSSNPISRVLSESSADNTPRTSSDIYSMSNRSDETLTSEAPSQQQNGRLLPKSAQYQNIPKSTKIRPAESETLMMAFAQATGSFTLDGSLVNAAPFEEVKRKGVQGGGGVVGIERPKRSSGVFGAFSWSNIGESLGGLLGNDDMSSMAQMKASAGSKAIPLLSTPQSLLFVDLKLAPGQSRSYNYRFALPRGLPPSYKGRAIKVTYHLSIGVQRPEGQAVKNVEVPFRVLGSYDARGDLLGHDLMSPYVLLQDAARTASIAPETFSPADFPKFASSLESRQPKRTPKQGLEDFLRYTERLVDLERDSNGVLLSPTSPSSPSISRQQSLADQAAGSTKEIIDFAILRSNFSNSGKTSQAEVQSANRFNIARSGQPVAVLTILRPAYRLGEAVIGTINFAAFPVLPDSPSQAATYSVSVELQSTEQIDSSLSLRSSSSISRVTRKVYGSMRENALYARQLSFNLSIPSTATPTFETTGVSLSWQLRVEFTTQRQTQGLGIDKASGGDNELLEELASDDRGTTYIAKELLVADTFEVAIPLKVYGAVGIDDNNAEDEALIV